MGQKRKGPSGGPIGKEVEFVPVKTARLGTRMKARRVRRQSSPSPAKIASPPKRSQTPSGFYSSTSQSQHENGFDYGYPFFDDQPGLVESMPGNSTKKKAGKVASICFIIQLPLTHFTDTESNAIGVVASQGGLFIRNINARGATCERKMSGMQC
jgi:hypothetical protein